MQTTVSPASMSMSRGSPCDRRWLRRGRAVAGAARGWSASSRRPRTRSPSWRRAGHGVQAERLLRGRVASPRRCRGRRSAGTPVPVRSKSKSCGSEAGSVTLTTVRRRVLGVRERAGRRSRPRRCRGQRCRLATARSRRETSSSPVHTRLVSVQPATAVSVTVLAPSWLALRLNVEALPQGRRRASCRGRDRRDARAGEVEVEVLGRRPGRSP